MNFTKTLVTLVVLSILAVGFGYWASKTKPAATVPMQQTHVLAGEQVGEGDLYRYAESGQYYTVEANYPGSRPIIEAALKTDIDQFKQNIEGLDATVMPSLADGNKLAFNAEFKTYTSGQLHTTSYAYTIYENTGGAHPNTYFKTFTFDQNGKEVGIKEVIASNPNGLEELSLLVSNEVTAQMKQRLSQDDVTGAIFAEGLAAKEENFSNFVVDGDTLVILIPPYQVAAYVMGSFEVRIKLKDIQ